MGRSRRAAPASSTRRFRDAAGSADSLARVEDRERTELERRARLLRGDRPRIPIAGRTVVLVDDGLATGATAAAACLAACRRRRAGRPGGSGRRSRGDSTATDGRGRSRLARCKLTDQDSVGAAYVDFHQLTDSEAAQLLKSP